MMKKQHKQDMTIMFFIFCSALFLVFPSLSESIIIEKLNGFFVRGTITAQGHIERNIDFSINNGVFEGKVTTSRTYHPRIIKLVITNTSIKGAITSKKLAPRLLEFSIEGNSIIGSADSENIKPRQIRLFMSNKKIEGHYVTEGFSDRYVIIYITEDRVFGSIESKNYSTRYLNFTLNNNVFKGTVTAKGSFERNVYLVLSQDTSDAIQMTLFFLLLDMQLRARDMVDDEYTSLNLNANLNLP